MCPTPGDASAEGIAPQGYDNHGASAGARITGSSRRYQCNACVSILRAAHVSAQCISKDIGYCRGGRRGAYPRVAQPLESCCGGIDVQQCDGLQYYGHRVSHKPRHRVSHRFNFERNATRYQTVSRAIRRLRDSYELALKRYPDNPDQIQALGVWAKSHVYTIEALLQDDKNT